MNNDLNNKAVVDKEKSTTAKEKGKNYVQQKKSSSPKNPAQREKNQQASGSEKSKHSYAVKSVTPESKRNDKPKEKKADKNEPRIEKKTTSVQKQTDISEKNITPLPAKSYKKTKPSDKLNNISSASSKQHDEERHEMENENKIGRKKRKKITITIPVVTAIVILTAGVIVSSAAMGIFNAEKHEAFIATKQSNVDLSNPQGKFLEGISVQGVDLNGKTMAEAKELLSIEESKLIPSINYTLTCHDKIVYLTEDDFDFKFDTVKVLNEAFEYSEYMRNILTEKGRTSLKNSEKKDYSITMTFVEDSIKTACEAVAKKVNVEMQNAHVVNIDTEKEKVSDMFSFEDGVVGYSVDVDDLITQIKTLKKNNNFSADIIGQMEVIEPTDDLGDLMKNLVLISQYTTYSGNTWAGNMNMATAMQSMTGSIIKPGEVFSFNEKTGNSNLEENGYYSAGVIVNGASANGIGGGICQAATTIYNAAIRAGMTVVEREPHTWPSTYVPVGIDSAIDYGSIDLKFRNDLDHEVYLICYMDGATLYAYIYGYKPSDFDEIVVSSWFTGSSGIGFGAGASRSYYKDGKVVKTEDLPSSFYSNGGGTSYAFDEPVSNYVFKKVFTDKQVSNMVKKVQEENKTTKDDGSTENKAEKKDKRDTDSTESTATNDSVSNPDNANPNDDLTAISDDDYAAEPEAYNALSENIYAENENIYNDPIGSFEDEDLLNDDYDFME